MNGLLIASIAAAIKPLGQFRSRGSLAGSLDHPAQVRRASRGWLILDRPHNQATTHPLGTELCAAIHKHAIDRSVHFSAVEDAQWLDTTILPLYDTECVQ